MNIKSHHKVYPSHKEKILKNMEAAYTQIELSKNWGDVLGCLLMLHKIQKTERSKN
jgi:hypothetical protein